MRTAECKRAAQAMRSVAHLIPTTHRPMLLYVLNVLDRAGRGWAIQDVTRDRVDSHRMVVDLIQPPDPLSVVRAAIKTFQAATSDTSAHWAGKTEAAADACLAHARAAGVTVSAR